ncbi:MAG: hypothetical protein K2X93_21825 [Candidatus Obscuribacterales bacterium]|nr:hypothetical protein [Candidatus Obscuribacterales bacterium]
MISNTTKRLVLIVCGSVTAGACWDPIGYYCLLLLMLSLTPSGLFLWLGIVAFMATSSKKNRLARSFD